MNINSVSVTASALRRMGIGLPISIIVTIAVLCAPLGLSTYHVRFMTTVLMYVALAEAWNLIGGYAGLLSLAHPTFFGVGAIGLTILLLNGVNPYAAAIVSCVVAIGLAFLMAVPTLRIRGHYFVVATMLISEGVRNVVTNFDGFGFSGGLATNITRFTGLRGLSGVQYNLLFYYVMAAVALLSILVCYLIDRGRWGYALRAFRDNRDAASALGVPTTRILTLVFVLSAALTSVTGSIWAIWLGVVDVNESFSVKLAFEIVVMVFLGGKGTILGPILGVFAILSLDELIGIEFSDLTLVSSGLIVIVVILFRPDGLVQAFYEGPAALSLPRLAANLRRYRLN